MTYVGWGRSLHLVFFSEHRPLPLKRLERRHA